MLKPVPRSSLRIMLSYNLLLTRRREIIATGLGMLAVMNKENQCVLVKKLKSYMYISPYQKCPGILTSLTVNKSLQVKPGKVGHLNRILTHAVCNASTNQLRTSPVIFSH